MHQPKNFSPEIQGLRGVAVITVMLFHIWPNLISGGYVGVDVFFVISGFLITGLLLKEAQESGTISLNNFYSRRIRRLLPAAVFVILVSSLFFSVLPQAQWNDIVTEMLASTFYVQNWWLGYQSVDYLAEDSALGLFRHYWSLSVEEQYYIFWPLLFILVTLLFPALRKQPKRVFAFLAISIGSASFFYSIYLTNHNPSLAYFATTTRAWELALGGGLAVFYQELKSIKVWLRTCLGWIGLILILAACFLFNQSTTFPGYLALLPTLGAAFVILDSYKPHPTAVGCLLRLRLMQYIGDISYSLYLWHWPVLIIYQAFFPDAANHFQNGLAILMITLILAHLSKVWVEDTFRATRHQSRYLYQSWMIFAASIVSVAILAACIALVIKKSEGRYFYNTPISPSLLTQPYDASKPTVPPANLARKDNADVYRLKCHVNQTNSDPSSCIFGDSAARNVIVLIGDSHAAHWLPALQEIYRKKPDWQIHTFTKSACAFNAATVTIGKDQRPYKSCSEWNVRVLDQLKQLKPQIIVISSSSGYRVAGIKDSGTSFDALVDGLLERWAELIQLSPKVLVIRDTPRMEQNIPECMSSRDASILKCSTSLTMALREDPIVAAIQRKPEEWSNLHYLDLTGQICELDTCKPVRGQVLIWRDSHHLTATFARLLSDKIEPHLFISEANNNE